MGVVTLSVRFQVRFLKTTMFKHLIEKMTRKAFIETFTAYKKMLLSFLGDKETTITQEFTIQEKFQDTNTTSLELTSQSFTFIISLLFSLLLLFFIICFALAMRLSSLRETVLMVKEQNLDLLQKIDTLIQTKNECEIVS